MTPFAPEHGIVIATPPGAGRGHWAGAPGLWREGADLFVAYRLRSPHPLRGYEMRVAALRGDRAQTVWRLPKERIGAESIERSALVRVDARWRLYLSFVAHRDRRWQIAMLEAAHPDAFDPRDVRCVLHPDDVGLSAVKDPWLRRVDGLWHMFVSCGARSDDARLHSSGDALSTGIVRSETGLLTSADGVTWRWEGVVFRPSRSGWDRATARLTTAFRDGEGWRAYYDGSGSHEENYEERCGLARSVDLRTWERVSVRGPAVGTAVGAGGVRYLDVTDAGDIAYEYTRDDGSHELRATSRRA